MPCGRQLVEIARAGELDRLHGRLGRRPADHDREVIGRAGGRAQRTQLLREELLQARGIEQRLGLLEEHRLVGRSASLGDEQELVLLARGRENVDLGRQVRAGVDLVVHREGNGLRVAEVLFLIRVVDSPRQPLLVLAPPVQTRWPFLPMIVAVPVSWHIGSSNPAATAALREGQGNAPVVGRRFGIVEDRRDLGEVRRAVQKRDIPQGFPRQKLERLRLDLEDLLPLEGRCANEIRIELAVTGRIRGQWERVLVGELWHDRLLPKKSRRGGSTLVGLNHEEPIVSRLKLKSRPEAGVLAERKIAADAQELVLALVVRNLIGKAQPAIRLRIEAVQGPGRQKELQEPAGSGQLGGVLSTSGGAIGASAMARAIALADFDIQALAIARQGQGQVRP